MDYRLRNFSSNSLAILVLDLGPYFRHRILEALISGAACPSLRLVLMLPWDGQLSFHLCSISELTF